VVSRKINASRQSQRERDLKLTITVPLFASFLWKFEFLVQMSHHSKFLVADNEIISSHEAHQVQGLMKLLITWQRNSLAHGRVWVRNTLLRLITFIGNQKQTLEILCAIIACPFNCDSFYYITYCSL